MNRPSSRIKGLAFWLRRLNPTARVSERRLQSLALLDELSLDAVSGEVAQLADELRACLSAIRRFQEDAGDPFPAPAGEASISWTSWTEVAV